jgi:hypothetical protein
MTFRFLSPNGTGLHVQSGDRKWRAAALVVSRRGAAAGEFRQATEPTARPRRLARVTPL